MMARSKIKTCILDGDELPDAAAVYRKLGDALGAPSYFGHNPDALWDIISEYNGEPIEIVWRNSTFRRATRAAFRRDRRRAATRGGRRAREAAARINCTHFVMAGLGPPGSMPVRPRPDRISEFLARRPSLSGGACPSVRTLRRVAHRCRSDGPSGCRSSALVQGANLCPSTRVTSALGFTCLPRQKKDGIDSGSHVRSTASSSAYVLANDV